MKSEPELLSPSTAFFNMSLDKFCLKRFFEIGFIDTSELVDDSFLKDLMDLNRDKSSVTHLTFISQEDTVNLLSKVLTDQKNLEFPPYLLPYLENFAQAHILKYYNRDGIVNEYQASNLKLKLIQTMYEQYADAIKESRRLEHIQTGLKTLIDKRPIRSVEKRIKQTKASSVKQAKKIEAKEDYTNVHLPENNISVEDSLDNEIYFYVIKGYNNLQIIDILTEMNVPTSFIIKVTNKGKTTKSILDIPQRYEDISGKYPQKVAFFKYEIPPPDESRSLESNLLKFIDIIKSVVNLKRLHFNYVKNLTMTESQFTNIQTSFPVYENLMNRYPLELITVPLMINGILQEVQMRLDRILKSASFHKQPKVSSKKKTNCPFHIKTQLDQPKQKNTQKKNYQPFTVHDNDLLDLTFRTYADRIEYQYVNDILGMLKLQKLAVIAQNINLNDFVEECDQSHRHNIQVPADDKKNAVITEEQANYLINLMYLKKLSKSIKKEETFQCNEFSEYLVTHNESDYAKTYSPKLLSTKRWMQNEIFRDNYCAFNLYESLAPLSFHWYESLKPETLLQQLFHSQQSHSSYDYMTCPFTDTLIVRFYTNVNSYGLSTKVWDDYIRTPVSFGHFCYFTVNDDYNWIKKNKLTNQTTYRDILNAHEEQTPIRLFNDDTYKNYKHLLLPQIQLSDSDLDNSECPCIVDNACTLIPTCRSKNETADIPKNSTDLQSILHELEEYNKSTDISQHCKTKREKENSLIAYNLGNTKLRIIGHSTNFVSLDGVALNIDTSRLSGDQFKLTATLTSNDHTLVVHIPQEHFHFHMISADGTVIVFSKPFAEKTEKKIDELKSIVQEDSPSDSIITQQQDSVFDNNSMEGSAQADNNMVEHEKTVKSMDFDHYQSLKLKPSVEFLTEGLLGFEKPNLVKEAEILKKIKENPSFMKVSHASNRRLKYLEKTFLENEIPVSAVVDRIINNPEKKENRPNPIRKCIIRGNFIPQSNPWKFDTNLTCPNGLNIKMLPSEIKTDSCVIKQAYKFAKAPEEIAEERYRIFSECGHLIIGRLDGCMSILTSSGIEIRYSKPKLLESEDKNYKIEKNLNEELIRKRLLRLMANQPKEDGWDYFISRRGHLKSRIRSISYCKKLEDLEYLPYQVVSIITPEGSKITIKDGKMFKILHSLHSNYGNPEKGEKGFKREDGFKSLMDRNGASYVEFADGTCIKTTLHDEEELLFIRKEDRMGWVKVNINITYENPYYKTTIFDNVKSEIQININKDDSLILNNKGTTYTKIDSTVISINDNSIDFKKTCPICNCSYTCNFSIKSLYSKSKPPEKAHFIVASDTYRKVFKSNYQGECRVYRKHETGILNTSNCPHATRTENQEIYFIKSDLSAMLLHNDRTILSQINETDKNRTIRHFNDHKHNPKCLKIVTNVHSKYDHRFYRQLQVRESKRNVETSPVVYQTIRIIRRLFEHGQIEGLLRSLQRWFDKEDLKDLKTNLSAVKFNAKQENYAVFTDVANSKTSAIDEIPLSEPKVTISFHSKMMQIAMIRSKVRKIMAAPTPKYFKSGLSPHNKEDTDTLKKRQTKA